MHALRSYLKLSCEYELHSLPNKKVSGAKDHGKNYIKVRPPLVRHLLGNRLLNYYFFHHFFHQVEHAWATKTYVPYFYLYEKPKHYEQCKPSPWLNGTDMRGNVFISFEVKSIHGSNLENNAKICQKYCCKEPRCAAWVLRKQSDATANCPKGELLVPQTEHHLSSFNCGFLNIFYRAKICCVVCHAYCFCYGGTNMARKNA